MCSILLGCADKTVEKQKDWRTMPLGERQAFFDQVAKDCRLPRTTFELRGEELRFQPRPTEDYEAVDCALKKAMADGRTDKIGFVGNERYWNEKK